MHIMHLDSQKAVGNVPHQRLLKKLSCYRITGIILWSDGYSMTKVGMEPDSPGISDGTGFVSYIINDWRKE